jgi:hypothetical protein
MFYESFGLLLREAAATLGGKVRPAVQDARARTQLDAVAALLADLGAMWDGLFAALEAENAILEAALSGGASTQRLPDDPLARQRELLEAFNARVEGVHETGDRRAVKALQEALLEAAAVQAELLERAREAVAPAGMRRV